MTPPCKTFDVSRLPSEIQFDFNDKKRKLAPLPPTPMAEEAGASEQSQQQQQQKKTPATATNRIDLLADCQLFSMTQYSCEPPDLERGRDHTRCWPVQRWFRRIRKTRDPVRSPIDKPDTAGLVVGSVTTSESPVLCHDKNGPFTVETTIWEKTKNEDQSST